MATLYRIEDSEGRGVAGKYTYCFEGMNTLAEDFSPADLARLGITIDKDMMPIYSSAARCAFPSRDALKNWFPRSMWCQLFRDGYRIRRYRTSDFIVGKSGQQAIF